MCSYNDIFNGLVVGFGPKGRPGRTCDSVRQKWGHTKVHTSDPESNKKIGDIFCLGQNIAILNFYHIVSKIMISPLFEINNICHWFSVTCSIWRDENFGFGRKENSWGPAQITWRTNSGFSKEKSSVFG